jgi:hypothetical protein
MQRVRWRYLALVLLLGGCNANYDIWRYERERAERANTTVPRNHRAEVVAFMRSYLNDPVGVRSAFISEPALRPIEGSNRYVVCLRYNPRRSGGQYAGSRDNLVVFRDGRLDRVVDSRGERGPDIAREYCKDAAYVPFAELEQMTR